MTYNFQTNSRAQNVRPNEKTFPELLGCIDIHYLLLSWWSQRSQLLEYTCLIFIAQNCILKWSILINVENRLYNKNAS